MGPFGVYQRKGSPFWWVWVGAGRAREFSSSGFRRDASLGYKHAFDLARERAGVLPAEAGRRGAGARGNNWDWVEDWLKFLLPEERQAKTLRDNLRQWSFLAAFFAQEGCHGPRGVDADLPVKFSTWRRENRYANRECRATTVVELRLLRRVLKEAIRRGIMSRHPMEAMKLRLPRAREKKEITAAEEVEIHAAIVREDSARPVGERWRTVAWLFGIHHGWRIHETSFPLERVNFERWEVLVQSKGDRWRTVPLHPAVRPILSALRAAGVTMSCMFGPGGATYASRIFCRLFKPRWPHLSHHCCRVSVISRLARRGIPESQVMAFVGHWSTSSHRIYQRVAHGDLLRCIYPDDPSSAAPPSPPPQTSASGETRP